MSEGRKQYTFEVDSAYQSSLDTVLSRLNSTCHEAMVNIYEFNSVDKGGVREYTIVADEVEERLSDRIEKRGKEPSEPFSSKELTAIAIACVITLAKAKELKLDVAGLDDTAVQFTRSGQVKVNLFEAISSALNGSVFDVLRKAAFLPASEDAMAALSERVSSELAPLLTELQQANPDFIKLAQVLDPSAPTITCNACRQTKVASIEQICAQHAFCSESCLRLVQETNKTSPELCPLCPLKVAPQQRKLVIKRTTTKNECLTCHSLFVLQTEDPWRLEFLGCEDYEKTKSFCSRVCFQPSESQPFEEEQKTDSKYCIQCKREGDSGMTILHCSHHVLCSNECLTTYYKGTDPRYHVYNGDLLCYECLQTTLDDMGDVSGILEFSSLKKQLAFFHQSQPKARKEACANACPCCLVVECGRYISPSVLTYRNFRTICIFCSTSILVRKEMNDDFRINRSTPFLISCEFRLHGVCSQDCMQHNMRASERFPQAAICPECEVGCIPPLSVDLALRANNPTIEFIRRTPIAHASSHECPAYFLEGCRHEVCGLTLNSMLNEDATIVTCNICGNKRDFELMVNSTFTYSMGELTREESNRFKQQEY